MSELEIYKGMVKKMKDDEIKQLLIQLEYFIDEDYDYYNDFELNQNQTKQLLDYITNLQHENERLLKQLEDVSLDEANIRADLMLEQVDYKARCEKAIEYIQKTKFCDNDECCILNETWFGKKLLNILNGRSDE